jgi:hypothetical protein
MCQTKKISVLHDILMEPLCGNRQTCRIKRGARQSYSFQYHALAYLYARGRGAKRIFLDVFADEMKLIKMYEKLGFEIIGSYSKPLPCTVMMMDHVSKYEQEVSRMEHFVTPFFSRLVPKIDFSGEDMHYVMKAIDEISAKFSKQSTEQGPLDEAI